MNKEFKSLSEAYASVNEASWDDVLKGRSGGVVGQVGSIGSLLLKANQEEILNKLEEHVKKSEDIRNKEGADKALDYLLSYLKID